MRKTNLATKVFSAALSLSMVAAFSPAMSVVAYADSGSSSALGAYSISEDGVYTADVSFDCGFAMGTTQASFANALANSKATVTMTNGTPTVHVAFGKGAFIMNGNSMPTTIIYLADSYTARNASAATSVEIAMATAGDGTYSADGVTYKKNDEGVITEIAFTGDTAVSTYYLQTGISGAQGMQFPYTTSAGSKSYASISIDWDSLASTPYVGTTALEAEKNYSIPVALKNAVDVTQDSMAKAAFPAAVLKVSADGDEALQLDVDPVTLGGTTAYCSDIKYCSTYTGETADANVIATTTVNGVAYPSQVSIDLDDAMLKQSGVYLTMTVGAMGRTTQAYLKLDSENVEELGTTSFTDVYKNLGLDPNADDYDVISSATGLTSFHAKDLPSITATKASVDGSTKTIVGVNLTNKRASVAPVAKTASYEYSSQYGTGEFIINPDDTVSGYVWNEYLNSIYAITVSDGTTTVGAVPWIDYYGENSTQGYHYNKIEVAMNNGVSPHNNMATVNRFAAFYAAGAEQISPGEYTLTTYAEGYEPMVATVTVLPTYAEEATATDIPLAGTKAYIGNLPADIANPKATISYTVGAGRGAVTTYLNASGADGDAIASDGSVAITIPEGLTADTAITIKIISDNYAPISTTATSKESVAISADPVAVKGLKYTGKAQTGVAAGMGYTVKGNTATNAGAYKATATLLPGYTWTDGTTADKTIAYSIDKVAQKVTAKKATAKKTVKASKKTKKLASAKYVKSLKSLFGLSANGKLTFKKTNKAGKSKITISKAGKVTVKKGLKKGTYTVKIKVAAAAATNYTAATKTITLKIVVK